MLIDIYPGEEDLGLYEVAASLRPRCRDRPVCKAAWMKRQAFGSTSEELTLVALKRLQGFRISVRLKRVPAKAVAGFSLFPRYGVLVDRQEDLQLARSILAGSQRLTTKGGEMSTN
jgi:hypothetical protein